MLMCQVQRTEECYSRRAQEHAKFCHHFTIKSVAKKPYNPRIWKTLLKARFQESMIVFGDCSYSKQWLKRKIDKKMFKN